MSNKLGNYISNLMTTVVNKESTDFVKNLALDELGRLNSEVDSFVKKHSTSEIEKLKKTEKILLQEEKKNAK